MLRLESWRSAKAAALAESADEAMGGGDAGSKATESLQLKFKGARTENFNASQK